MIGKICCIGANMSDIQYFINRESDGEQFILTKGDNNHADDREGIYNPGQQWISHKDVVGRVVG
jgi:hypothetical protein